MKKHLNNYKKTLLKEFLMKEYLKNELKDLQEVKILQEIRGIKVEKNLEGLKSL